MSRLAPGMLCEYKLLSNYSGLTSHKYQIVRLVRLLTPEILADDPRWARFKPEFYPVDNWEYERVGYEDDDRQHGLGSSHASHFKPINVASYEWEHEQVKRWQHLNDLWYELVTTVYDYNELDINVSDPEAQRAAITQIRGYLKQIEGVLKRNETPDAKWHKRAQKKLVN